MTPLSRFHFTQQIDMSAAMSAPRADRIRLVRGLMGLLGVDLEEISPPPEPCRECDTLARQLDAAEVSSLELEQETATARAEVVDIATRLALAVSARSDHQSRSDRALAAVYDVLSEALADAPRGLSTLDLARMAGDKLASPPRPSIPPTALVDIVTRVGLGGMLLGMGSDAYAQSDSGLFADVDGLDSGECWPDDPPAAPEGFSADQIAAYEAIYRTLSDVDRPFADRVQAIVCHLEPGLGEIPGIPDCPQGGSIVSAVWQLILFLIVSSGAARAKEAVKSAWRGPEPAEPPASSPVTSIPTTPGIVSAEPASPPVLVPVSPVGGGPTIEGARSIDLEPERESPLSPAPSMESGAAPIEVAVSQEPELLATLDIEALPELELIDLPTDEVRSPLDAPEPASLRAALALEVGDRLQVEGDGTVWVAELVDEFSAHLRPLGGGPTWRPPIAHLERCATIVAPPVNEIQWWGQTWRRADPAGDAWTEGDTWIAGSIEWTGLPDLDGFAALMEAASLLSSAEVVDQVLHIMDGSTRRLRTRRELADAIRALSLEEQIAAAAYKPRADGRPWIDLPTLRERQPRIGALINALWPMLRSLRADAREEAAEEEEDGAGFKWPRLGWSRR